MARVGSAPPSLPVGVVVCRGCCRSLTDPFSIRHNGPGRATQTWCFACPGCGHTEAVEISDQLLASLPSALWVPAEKPKPDPSPQPERTIQGSVIGYRAWRIVAWQLYGTGVNRAWVPGVNEATCDAGSQDYFGGALFALAAGYGPEYGRHPAPALGCHCGITCLARFDQGDAHWTNADVFGAIEAWGEEGQVVRPEPGDVAEATRLDLQRTDQGQDPHEDSGGFILHRNGFRARYGKVVLLAVDEDWPAPKTAAVRALAREHGADVCKREHLEDAAKEHGQLVDEELLEWVAKDEPSPYEGLAANLKTVAGMFQVPSVWVSSPNQGRAALGLPPLAEEKPAKSTKGIKQTLGIVGPPPSGRHSKGDRVKDSKGTVWQCVKGGRPGTWADEADGEYWEDE